MSSVLVVTVPSERGGDLYLMRDYVRESLELGVLIVGEGVRWELLELPELGELRVQATEAPEADKHPETPDEGEPEGEVAFIGCGAKEKRRIYEDLRRYRDRNGLGSLEPLAELAGQGLTTEVLRGALLGDRLPMDTWRAIGKALDLLGVGPNGAGKDEDHEK